ncbi:MAG: c-type cytochrome biogenesis protein CcmI [Rhodocyclaceae bacterium]|nr:c-type cytochrome biogenesis protein CcmI [Rhodocyclaceae bacterium]
MIGFLVAAAVLVAAVLAWLGASRRRATATASRDAINAAIYRDQLAELDRDRDSGALAAADWEQARDEIRRRLLEDGGADAVDAAAAPGRRTFLAIAVVLPVAAAALYLLLGTPAGFNPPPAAAGGEPTAAQIEGMVSKLAEKLEKQPDNLEGWVMLGRSYAVLGRMDEAARAFERGMPLIEKNARLLADYAELLAQKADGRFAGKPTELIEKALKVDPDEPQTLVLAGLAAMERKDYRRAVAHWERLRKQVPDGSDEAHAIDASLAKARAGLK